MSTAIQLPEQRPAYAIPPGFGFHRLKGKELAERSGAKALFNTLQIWELPRKGHRYVISVDVADGIGKDRSVADVFRLGTLEEGEEQVAQFLSDDVAPRALAGVIDAIGHLYTWPDGREALVVIENNNHGISVQDTLQLHLGYRHFYLWEVLDQADPAKRWTTKIGWTTTPRTRPILLDQLYTGITTVDPITGYSDCRLNSPFTLDEMRDFTTDGALWEAEAKKGAHDDCMMAAGIGHYVCWRLAGGETEPLADRRRRRAEEDARRKRLVDTVGGEGAAPRDFRNSDVTHTQQQALEGRTRDDREGDEDEDEQWFYDPDSRGQGGTLY